MTPPNEPDSPLGPLHQPTPTGVLARRFDQMFPVLSSAEIDRVRRFGEVRRFGPGELLIRAGKPSPGMYVVLSGRLAVVSQDPLGRSIPIAEFAQVVGGTLEEMEILPGEVLAEMGTLSGRPSALEVQAVEEVQAILVLPEQLRALLVEEAELGERILSRCPARRCSRIRRKGTWRARWGWSPGPSAASPTMWRSSVPALRGSPLPSTERPKASRSSCWRR